MVLFLALSAPAATLMLLGMIDLSLIRRAPLYRPAAAGFLWFFPVMGLVLVVTRFGRLSFETSTLFWTAFWLDYVVWIAAMAVGSLPAIRALRDWDAPAVHSGHLLFLGVAFTLLGLAEIVQFRSYLSLYAAFLRPALRVALLVVVPVVGTVAFTVRNGLVALPILLVGPALAATVAVLAETNRAAAAIVLAVIWIGGAFALLWWFLPWARWSTVQRRS